jgi:hypothetical protein
MIIKTADKLITICPNASFGFVGGVIVYLRKYCVVNFIGLSVKDRQQGYAVKPGGLGKTANITDGREQIDVRNQSVKGLPCTRITGIFYHKGYTGSGIVEATFHVRESNTVISGIYNNRIVFQLRFSQSIYDDACTAIRHGNAVDKACHIFPVNLIIIEYMGRLNILLSDASLYAGKFPVGIDHAEREKKVPLLSSSAGKVRHGFFCRIQVILFRIPDIHTGIPSLLKEVVITDGRGLTGFMLDTAKDSLVTLTRKIIS